MCSRALPSHAWSCSQPSPPRTNTDVHSPYGVSEALDIPQQGNHSEGGKISSSDEVWRVPTMPKRPCLHADTHPDSPAVPAPGALEPPINDLYGDWMWLSESPEGPCNSSGLAVQMENDLSKMFKSREKTRERQWGSKNLIKRNRLLGFPSKTFSLMRINLHCFIRRMNYSMKFRFQSSSTSS